MEGYKRAIIGIAVIIAVGTVAFFLFFSGDSPKEDPLNSRKGIKPVQQEVKKEAPVEEKKPEPVKSEAPNPFNTTALNESDTAVKDELETCSDSKIFASILANEDLIRKFTATVLNISRGESPAKHIPFMKPGKRFQVADHKDKPVLNIASYKRYNFVASLITSLDTEKSVTKFNRLKPLFTRAMKELGMTDTEFESVLEKAFLVLLKTPVVYGNIGLEKKFKSWEFKDPQLVKMNEAQKHLFRMGPENIKRIHSKIREFGKALGMAKLPASKTYLPKQ